MVSSRVTAPVIAITSPSWTSPRSASTSSTVGGVQAARASISDHRNFQGLWRGGPGSVSRTIDGCSADSPQPTYSSTNADSVTQFLTSG